LSGILHAGRFLNLDDESLLSSLALDPFGQLTAVAAEAAEAGLPVSIDEVQRLPQLTLAIKRIVDKDPRPGQFVLTVSLDVFTTPRALDSLAGRVTTLTLRPLSAAEIQRQGPCQLLDSVWNNADVLDATAIPAPALYTRRDAIDLIIRGGFPEIRQLDDVDRMERYASYIAGVVEGCRPRCRNSSAGRAEAPDQSACHPHGRRTQCHKPLFSVGCPQGNSGNLS